MNKKLVSGMVQTLLLIGILMLTFKTKQVNSEPKTWKVDNDGPADFSKVQDAINAASQGDIINVKPGTYYEHLTVNKAISLIGENKRTTIINGNSTGTVAYVVTKNVTVSNFTLRNGEIGVQLYYTGGSVTLSENNIINNERNFWVEGHDPVDFMHQIDTSNAVDGKPICYLVNKHDEEIPTGAGYVAVINSTNITVKKLNINRNGQGILLAFSKNSSVENVNVKNSAVGIALRNCQKISVKNNTLENNRYAIYVYKNWNTTIAGNVIVNNILRGIYMEDYCRHNLILENIVSKNEVGIEFESSVKNVFRDNTISKNKYGFSIASSDNMIYLNNFIDNTVHVTDDILLHLLSLINTWDAGYPLGGNYWSDYKGVDEKNGSNQDQPGSDGIGDTPYTIDENNQDRYPIMTIMDRTAPTISITFPSNGSEIKSSTITASWVGIDYASGISHYEIRLDGGSWANVETDTTHEFTGLNDGSHKIDIKAIDKVGNLKQDTVCFTVNTSPLFGPGYVEEVAITATIVIAALGTAVYLLKIRKKN